MSYLYRNGNGRNNIVWGGSTSTSLNYLRRTSNTSLNSIQWYTISNSGTYNILERYNNTRNGIRWNNITFSFVTLDCREYRLETTTIDIGSGKQAIAQIISYDKSTHVSTNYKRTFEVARVQEYLVNGWVLKNTGTHIETTSYQPSYTNSHICIELENSIIGNDFMNRLEESYTNVVYNNKLFPITDISLQRSGTVRIHISNIAGSIIFIDKTSLTFS